MISLFLLGATLLGQPPVTFFNSIRGTYSVELANGKPPHKESAVATVEVDDASAELAMPYCTDTMCDPGYLSFPFDKTIVATEGSANTIITTTDGKTYAWFIEGNNRFRFVNYQYKTKTETLTLEHVLVVK